MTIRNIGDAAVRSSDRMCRVRPPQTLPPKCEHCGRLRKPSAVFGLFCGADEGNRVQGPSERQRDKQDRVACNRS
jgi:hypothetical protein